MKTLKTLTMALPLFVLAGCGCTSDELPFFPQRIGPFRIATRIAPVPVPPPRPQPVKKRIDVLFLMDDSGQIVAGSPNQGGMVFGNVWLDDARDKQAAARVVFKDIVDKLKLDLATAYPAEQFDVAFGVARYEDYGGTFRAADATARPFILNQPIYRQERNGFGTKIDDALARTAPGNGNSPALAPDAQSIVEALFQVGTGAGFDGNGNGNKTDAGPFGGTGAQTGIEGSGDVPAASFTADGNDEDGEPQFTTPGGLLSSGNLGGAGWRPDALRYVITTSDISGVTPFTSGPIPLNATSTSGGAYPRNAKSVPTQAFASVFGDAAAQAAARFGVVPDPVAPTGAASLQASVDALNTGANALKPLNIEVLSIGFPFYIPVTTKPNLPGPEVPPQTIRAITNPSTPSSGPWTWMSAYAILTGAQRPWPPVAPTSDLPLVYNLQTVLPKTQATPNPDIREDLVYRIGQGLPTLPSVGAPPARPALTPAEYEFSASVTPSGVSPFALASLTAIDTDGGGAAVSVVAGQKIRVLVPRYWNDDPVAPASIRIEWLVQLAEVATDNLLKSDTLPFEMLPVAISPDDPVAFAPTPAKGTNQGTVATNWPPSPPADAPTAALGANIVGCTIVRDDNHATETSGGVCP